MSAPRRPAPDAPGGCPDWAALAAARDQRPGDPPGWEAALAHLDDCARCRREAPAADPMLVFRRLPAFPAGNDEVEAMRLRVAALRSASAVAPPRRRWRPVGQGLAAAAMLAVALLSGSQAPGPVARTAPPPALAAEIAAQPLIEELDQPFDSVVQWNADDLSVVVVVDERFAAGAGG